MIDLMFFFVYGESMSVNIPRHIYVYGCFQE